MSGSETESETKYTSGFKTILFGIIFILLPYSLEFSNLNNGKSFLINPLKKA